MPSPTILLPFQVESKVYTPERHQLRFHQAVREHDYTYLKGGLGSGKTTAGALQAIIESCHYQPGSSGLIIAPTYKMLHDSTMREFFRWLPPHYIASHRKDVNEIVLTNGSIITYRSGDDPDTLRGPNMNWVWLDEPRNYRTRDVFDQANARCRPTIKMWLTSTPAGIFHWLYQLFIEKPLPNSKWIHARTSENRHNGNYYERMKAALSEKDAKQELEAEDISFEGLVYDNFSARNFTEEAEYNPAYGPLLWAIDDGYAYGEGPGYPSYHPRVILFCQETPIGGINVFDELFVCGQPEFATTIDEALTKPWPRVELAYIDSSAAAFRGALTVKNINNTGATHTVKEGIRNLRRMISDANGQVLFRVHPRCKQTHREFLSYRTNDRSSLGEPLKVDDHSQDAARYIAWHLRYNAN